MDDTTLATIAQHTCMLKQQLLKYESPQLITMNTIHLTLGGGVNILESQSGGGDLSS